MVLGNQSKQKTCGCVTSKTEEGYLFKLVFQLQVREPGHASISHQGFTVKITATRLFLHRSPKHGPHTPHILWPLSAARSPSSPRDTRKRGRRPGPLAENLSHGADNSSRSLKATRTPTAPRPWPCPLRAPSSPLLSGACCWTPGASACPRPAPQGAPPAPGTSSCGCARWPLCDATCRCRR